MLQINNNLSSASTVAGAGRGWLNPALTTQPDGSNQRLEIDGLDFPP